jgi:hypothetical protein
MSVAITIKDLQGRPLYTTEIPLNRDDRSRSPVRDDNQLRVHHDNAFPPRAMEQPSDPDSLVIGVGRPGRVEYHFTIKKNAPLRRLVNMYAGFEHRDVKLFELHWQGECIGVGNDPVVFRRMVLIILQYGITHGTELTIVASAFMYSGNLLRE